MIKVRRGAAPAVLTKNASGWRTELMAASSPQERKRCERRYRHPQIKAALLKLFHGKCAYCESVITHVEYGHIEHFCPKAGARGRPQLTFDWNNLFLACGVCNGAEFKGTKFPTAEEGGPFVNPCDDVPLEHFIFEFNPQTQLASVWGITQRGELTERTLGLNRLELRRYRSEQVKKLAYIALRAVDDPEANALWVEAQADSSEYAAFARALIDLIAQRSKTRNG